MKKSLFLLIFLFIPPCYAAPVAGWIEWVELDQKLAMQAKLDSGAKTTSLHASEVKFYQVKNVPWVKFQVHTASGHRMEFNKKVVRIAKIKNHFGKKDLRPVVEMKIRICNLIKLVEVNLSDRSGYNYPVLIGRNYLAGNYLVDTENMYLINRSCRHSDAKTASKELL